MSNILFVKVNFFLTKLKNPLLVFSLSFTGEGGGNLSEGGKLQSSKTSLVPGPLGYFGKMTNTEL
uniref:Uncharacterized protein n=1 Tax=Anguilla anguilla TaxID=7936 RepID=A0A0E9XQ85_ANGAN